MLRRTARGLIRVLAGLVAGFAMVVLVCAWVLSRGPVSLALFEDQITDFLHGAFPTVRVAFDDTILAWAGWDRAVDIQVINLRMVATDGKFNLSAPGLAFSISTRAMLEGVAAPSRLELSEPAVFLQREASEQFGKPSSKQSDTQASMALTDVRGLLTDYLKPFFRELSAAPRADDPLGYLKSIVVKDADITVEDRTHGKSWVTPDVQLNITRDDGRLDGEASFLMELGNSVADISVIASYDVQRDRIDAGISFDSVIPSALPEILPELANLADFYDLADFQVPLHGTVTIASSLAGELEGVGFDIAGDSGQVMLPLAQENSLAVDSMVARGQFDALKNTLEIETFSAHFTDGYEFAWPLPVNHSFPVRSVHASGRYLFNEQSLNLKHLDVDMGGFDLHLGGVIQQLTTAPQAKVRIEIPSLSVQNLKTSWPKSLLGDAQRWVTQNIVSGDISGFHLDLETGADADGASDGEIIATDVAGGFSLERITLRYIDEMPTVTDAVARVSFDQDRFDFDITSARSAGMGITSAMVSLYDLSTGVELADISVSVRGGFDQAMAVIDHEPLALTTDLGIDPATVSGQAQADLSFRFPLRNDLAWPDVSVSAQARTQDASIPGGLFDLDVNEARLYMAVDNDGMDISGALLLHKFPGRLAWRRNFAPDAEVANTYDLAVEVADAGDVADLGMDLGVDLQPFTADMINGTVPLDVHVTERNDGTTDVKVTAELDRTELDGPVINWHKNAGEPGLATVSLEFIDKKIANIPEFFVKTDDLTISGRAAYAEPGGHLSRIELDRINHNRTAMSGLLVSSGNGVWDADFRGDSLDLSALWEDILHGDALASGESALKDISLSVQFDQVHLPKNRNLWNVAGVLSRSNDIWRTVYLSSIVEGGQTLDIKLTPSEKDNARILTVWSLDGGAVLRTLDIYENMVGGELSLTGTFDDSQPASPLSARMDIQDYRILRAPSLAKILNLLALTGFIDILQGEGLGFDELVVPFRYQDGILDIEDAKATGTSLGFTASGQVYSRVDRIDLNGTIIPAYTLNAMLGHIPIVGAIFSGGEDGGGLIASNYSVAGPLEDPETTINPLSILTPGFLRNIFDIGSGDKDRDNGANGDGASPVLTEKNGKDKTGP